MPAKRQVQEATGDPDWFDEADGQVALDVYQTEDNVILKAPIAGVKESDLELTVTDEVVTIKGTRSDMHAESRDAYFLEECYWGSFSRSYVLPVAVDADRAQAVLQAGLLTITIPKLEKSKARTIQVQSVA
jgi:HSP20 family protein